MCVQCWLSSGWILSWIRRRSVSLSTVIDFRVFCQAWWVTLCLWRSFGFPERQSSRTARFSWVVVTRLYSCSRVMISPSKNEPDASFIPERLWIFTGLTSINQKLHHSTLHVYKPNFSSACSREKKNNLVTVVNVLGCTDLGSYSCVDSDTVQL